MEMWAKYNIYGLVVSLYSMYSFVSLEYSVRSQLAKQVPPSPLLHVAACLLWRGGARFDVRVRRFVTAPNNP